ncbi:amino acid adenylation domain-containing protein [Streptomyces sp. NPDC127584]|uniref:amino acid adenylation domain-containing protein n=1 Tax=Streptomyces sp. NPDC127584 TaxID=3345403 RepID=UPI00363E85EB
MTATRDALPEGTPSTTGWTTIPRWTTASVPGVDDRVSALPDGMTPMLGERARELGVPVSALHLAAHAKVLAALSGDRVVTTARLTAPGRYPPCRVTAAPGTWRDLVHAAAREQELLGDRGDPRADDPPGTSPRSHPDVLLDPDGHGPVLPPGAVLCVTVTEDAGRPVLRSRFRTDALDGDAVARIAGYHVTALRGLLDDPDAPHDTQRLLSDAEIRFQVDGLAGPPAPLPDLRFHELFEERVRRHPDRVAAVHRGRRWTYRDLNLRANRLARALLARGLRREETVAAVLPRDLYWMAAVLAVLKAGGSYLPVDPDYPPDRIAAILNRAECRLVLSEPGSTGNVDRAFPSEPGSTGSVDRACPPPRSPLVVLDAPTVAESGGDGSDLGIPVPADALAYIFFTSGSTGEPKGAMVEHAGMLNHLLAKTEDLRIGAGSVVAQTASQCFDISVWQLLASTLVGGRTLLVEQEAVLDVHRLLELVAEEQVTVLQVVPSYLDVLVSALERTPRPLPALRYLSVTGEALRAELVRRWFRVQPGSRLVNAYGLTETSDDTNHDVMHRAPEDGRVTLGRPVRNVRVYVVDDGLTPVPLGATGTVAFSGICVGRGYVNDPERTAECYRPDPHRPGERLYLGGDLGRWLPDGRLEFLGRRDAQVKIRGFRVEIGDVEAALLRVPGVRDAAVVVTGRTGHGRNLVAFHSGDPELGSDRLRHLLGDLLPAYMVPARCHRQDPLPLTPNGKIDRKALNTLAEAWAHGDTRGDTPGDADGDAPRPGTEERLARAWAAVLGADPATIGRGDRFFDLGGTSLTAVQLAVALDRAVSLRDLTASPTLADLAALIDARTGGDRPADHLIDAGTGGDRPAGHHPIDTRTGDDRPAGHRIDAETT